MRIPLFRPPRLPWPEAIHSIDYPAKSRFIRVTGTNLDLIPRRRFDLATGKATQMTPQQAT